MGHKTILVLGAQGLLGRFTAQRLSAAGHTVVRAGRRPENSPDFRFVDLDQIDTLTAALEGVDLVVSSIEDPQTRAEREVLRGGGVLLSQATIPAPDQRRLRADVPDDAKGTVVLNSGLTGVMSLVVKHLLECHRDADTIELGFVGSVLASMGTSGGKTAHTWFSSEPRVLRVERLFTDPRGSWPCFDMSHFDFLWTSEDLVGRRTILMYIGLAERPIGGLLAVLSRLRLLRFLPQSAFTGPIQLRRAPTALTTEPIRMRTALYRNGELLAARGLGARGDYNSTTISTALFVDAVLRLADHDALPSGNFNIEELLQWNDVQESLSSHHIEIQSLPS